MMKKILLFIFIIFCSYVSFGQVPIPGSPLSVTVTNERGMFNTNLYPPRSAFGGNLFGGLDTLGAINYSRGDSSLYYYIKANRYLRVLSLRDTNYIKTLIPSTPGSGQNLANTDLNQTSNRFYNGSNFFLNFSNNSSYSFQTVALSNGAASLAINPTLFDGLVSDGVSMAGDVQASALGVRLYNKNKITALSTQYKAAPTNFAWLDSTSGSPFTVNPVPVHIVRYANFSDINMSQLNNDAGFIIGVPGLDQVAASDSIAANSMYVQSLTYNPVITTQNLSTGGLASLSSLGRLILTGASGSNVQVRSTTDVEFRNPTSNVVFVKLKQSGAVTGAPANQLNDFVTLQQMIDSIATGGGGGGGSGTMTALSVGAGMSATSTPITTSGTVRVALHGIQDSLIRQRVALSIMGNNGNSLSDVEDIRAYANGQILVRTADTLGFITAQDVAEAQFLTRVLMANYNGLANMAIVYEATYAGQFVYQDTSTATPDGINVIAATGKGIGNWIRRPQYNSGGGGGSGTVTSVALTVPTGLSVSGSPVTTSGTLAITTTLNGYVKGNGSGLSAVSAIPVADVTGAATTTTSQTLTNKTLTSPIINVTSDATGDIYYRNSGGAFTRLGIGATNDVLTVIGGIPTWQAGGGGGGNVTRIGTINNATASANGAVINTVGSVDSLIMQDASATMPGLMTINSQTLAGDKTWNGIGIFGNGLYVSTNINNSTFQAALNSVRNTQTGFKVLGQSTTFRVAERGSANNSLQANDAGVNHLVGIQGFQKATSGNHPILTNFYADSVTISNDGAGGTVTNAANIGIAGDPVGITTSAGSSSLINWGSMWTRGNVRWGTLSTSSSTVTVDSTSNHYVFTGTTSTFTMPSLTNTNYINSSFWVINLGSGNLTVQGATGSVIVDIGTTTASANVVLASGTSAQFFRIGTSSWKIIHKQ